VALKLMYLMFANLLAWMALRIRSNTTKDNVARHGHRSAGGTVP
jgi:hypothetical protein